MALQSPTKHQAVVKQNDAVPLSEREKGQLSVSKAEEDESATRKSQAHVDIVAAVQSAVAPLFATNKMLAEQLHVLQTEVKNLKEQSLRQSEIKQPISAKPALARVQPGNGQPIAGHQTSSGVPMSFYPYTNAPLLRPPQPPIITPMPADSQFAADAQMMAQTWKMMEMMQRFSSTACYPNVTAQALAPNPGATSIHAHLPGNLHTISPAQEMQFNEHIIQHAPDGFSVALNPIQDPAAQQEHLS